jgi:hypothetical protein
MVRSCSRRRWALAGLVMLAWGTSARAETTDHASDDEVRSAYDRIAPRIHAEYNAQFQGMARGVMASGAPASKIELFQKRLKMLAYNRAALVAGCIADAEHNRPPTATPVPMQNNLMLTTCVGDKVRQLQKFSDLVAYADFFFPERIETCGEQVRLPEREKVLRPYDFLQLDAPKLYDFARYSECLMKR